MVLMDKRPVSAVLSPETARNWYSKSAVSCEHAALSSQKLVLPSSYPSRT